MTGIQGQGWTKARAYRGTGGEGKGRIRGRDVGRGGHSHRGWARVGLMFANTTGVT